MTTVISSSFSNIVANGHDRGGRSYFPEIIQATQFLKLLDPVATGFTFQTFHDRAKGAPELPGLARTFHASDLRWLIELHNSSPVGAYVTVNRTNGKDRKIENIVSVRAVWQEADDAGEHQFPLEPSIVVETSPSHYHRYWLVDGDWPADKEGKDDFDKVMKRMDVTYKSDPGGKGINRVLRIPGFLHRKTERHHLVKIVGGNQCRYTRAEIIKAFPPVEEPKTEAPPHGGGRAEPGELPEELVNLISNPPNGNRSKQFHRAVCWLKELGYSLERIALLLAGQFVARRYEDGGRLYGEIKRSWDKAKPNRTRARPDGGLSVDDFYAYLPTHHYIFTPTLELWPAASVNAVLGNIEVNGKSIPANQWLDQTRPVHQMTWAPGEPAIIEGKLLVEEGWTARPGTNSFNLYRGPTIELGTAANAAPWIEHVRKVYPADADHIITWLAHRVQRPEEKINHCLLLGGEQGIGKDTLIDPVREAVGPANVEEVSPIQAMGRFNGFLKSIILRISETRDQGESDRFKFYAHTKTMMAAPPNTLKIDEKFKGEYRVMNVCGVILTTNHKTDGIYLAPDDRRHFVAWSDRTKQDFPEGYFPKLWGWYHNGGFADVAAYLSELDISSFDAKAPPPKTPAFWDIVDANRAPEDGEIADILDHLGNPDAVTLDQIRLNAHQEEIAEWLKDRRNRRSIPHRMERCGYVQVRNDAAKDGLWKINNRRQAVYAKKTLPPQQQQRVVRDLADR